MEASVVRRSKRQKAEVDYSSLLAAENENLSDIQLHNESTNSHHKLARIVLKWPETSDSLAVLSPENLLAFAHSTGFHNPCVVRRTSATPQALGIRLPRGKLTVKRLEKLLGHDFPVNTIDVATQLEGPVYSMKDWVSYYSSPAPRKALLNVVSLDLAETPLRNMVSVPSVVKELDLVGKAWPHTDHCGPKVQLYALMSVANCYTDFHIDFGGSSVWYHVLSGRKVFLLVPPNKGNLLMFEEWSSSERQASISFAERATDCQKVELLAGDTLFIPGGWPHCVATPVDSLVVGGNFLTGYNLSLQCEIWHMEERLKVRRKFRYPLYKPLMWHTAAYYLKMLERRGKNGTKANGLTVWEIEGIETLCRSLQSWLQQSCNNGEVPQCVSDPNALLKELKRFAEASFSS